MTSTRPGSLLFFFPLQVRSSIHAVTSALLTFGPSRVLLFGVGDSLHTVRIMTLYSFTAAEQWGMFQGPSQECLLQVTCTHIREIKKRGETFVPSNSGLRQSLWLLTQFVLLQAKFCHDDDLKCAPSALSASCNGQWDFDSRAVIGSHLGTVSVFYSPVCRMYSFRTWLVIARAGIAGQRRRYPLETPALFWHRLSVHNGLRSQALHERFYMETPKANWPVEIWLIVSSAWFPVAMAAI